MGYSIAAIFGEVLGYSSQRKIIGLVQSFINKLKNGKGFVE